MPIIPSIDLLGGNAVQLVGGNVEALKVNAGDPRPIAKQFRVAGDIAVVDLDAALGRGNNKETILDLIKLASCRVGGGIRSLDAALFWLNAGATKIVLGTAATPEILSQLPKERLVAALDAMHGKVVVKGWKENTGVSVIERLKELKSYVSGFLVTFVEREGRMEGLDWDLVAQLKEVIGDATLTIAGGVTTAEDVAKLDAMGIEAQVGMALYTKRMDLGEAIAVNLKSDRPDGLIPTVVVDETRKVLGQVYSSVDSIKESVKNLKGVYQSRNRGLWRKGETSGATQDLLKIEIDCDRDSLCFIVIQNGGGFCHLERRSCFGPDNGFTKLQATLQDRLNNPIKGSYTNRLFDDSALLRSKLLEEAEELSEAKDKDEAAWEAADVIYFTMVAALKKGATLEDIERHLDLRSLKVTRRPGDAKPPKTETKVEETSKQEVKEEVKQVPVASSKLEEGNFLLRRVSPSSVAAASEDPIDDKVYSISRDIVEDVRNNGESAMLKHAVRLGDIKEGESYILDKSQMEKVFLSLPQSQRETLERTAERIKKFAKAQRDCITELSLNIEGGKAGHFVEPCERAGCYAPGGRFPLPSSVLMTAVTARVAGCKEVWVASPRPVPVTIAAAHLAGADSMLCIGGAQAIAALAHGAGKVPQMDVIVGPGNKYVTAAKQIVSGRVKIDMLAGPSECLVIADESADPATVAADLLAQAEHDPDARPILVTQNERVAEAVDAEISKQLDVLPTQDIARQAVKKGFAVICKDLEECGRVSDVVAPEHLEVHVKNAKEYSKTLKHWGGLFIGTLSGEVLGDYGAGPNHVLPTGATARNSGGLSVFTFLRIRTWIDIQSAESSQILAQDARDLALLEGLHGHAAAASRRLLTASSVSSGKSSQTLQNTSVSSADSQFSSRFSPDNVKEWLRTDLFSLDKYKPIRPLEVVADEVGLPLDQLVKLDGNENSYGPHELVRKAVESSAFHVYPDPSQTFLRKSLSEYVNYPPEWIVAGSGSDDLLDILVRLVAPRFVCVSTPTFGMYSFLGKLNCASLVDVPRSPDNGFKFPFDEFKEKISQIKEKKIVFLPSPNNPTGDVLPNDQIQSLCSSLDCLVILDEAYAEFSGKSCIELVKNNPNLVVLRTFSKWAGCAGLRLGFAVANPSLVEWMMAIKQPYNVNIAADVAGRESLRLRSEIEVSVQALSSSIKKLSKDISERFSSWLSPVESEANFVLVKVSHRSAADLANFLRFRGILIRYFDTAALKGYIRISAGKPEEMDRVLEALQLYSEGRLNSVKPSPSCLLLDLDGVLADVSTSYREAIVLTALHFGLKVTMEDITAAKMKGNANNDWILTHKLLQDNGVAPVPSLEDVTAKFEEFYQGTEEKPGLWTTETLLVDPKLLQDLSAKFPLAIVTGRPRNDAQRFLRHFSLDKYFQSVVCMEDAALKPSPEPVKLALRNLGKQNGMMVGDTPDDILSARGAGITGLGIPAPKERGNQKTLDSLYSSGAYRVLQSLEDLRQLL
eukprot:TRINITY_DN3584_c1_g1_i3.p1 TRINITY_DN3584_c1_g1~~TRINITY_DN3584_c1_g1_i3.p1  ORF type:complete len:1502 (-),score=554.93 TRINITY_DN3584_c1_g1_i3:1002-5507(-)